jgi:hypothetical protein
MNKKVCSIFGSRHHTYSLFAKAHKLPDLYQAFLLPVLSILRWYFYPAQAGPLREGV